MQVKLLEPQVAYDYSRADLEAMSRTAYHPVSGGHTVGLTAMAFHYDFNVEARVTRSDDRSCIVPMDLVVSVGYTDATVYVRRDQTSSECRRRAVLDHENTHVRINMQTLREAADGIQRDVSRMVAQRVAVSSASEVGAEAELKRQIGTIVDDAVRPMTTRRDTLHREFDDRESEDRRVEQCQ